MRILSFMAVVVSLLVASCNHHQQEQKNIPAEQLYSESVRLTRSYIDSLKLAKDSIELQNLEQEYLSRLDEVNFKYPPDTDLMLDEAQNDTLAILAARFVQIRKAKLEKFAANNMDSIPR